jgi:hypothetical protein
MAVHRAKKKAVAEEKEEQRVLPGSPLSDTAMERLAQIMNDTPSIVKLKGTEYKITALKPGTQWLIAEEACKIVKGENLSMGDVIKEFATNLPAVARVLTLAMLNDKDRIFSDEYQKIYDILLWGDFEMRDWAGLLVEILKLIDVDFFFASTNVIQTVRNQTLMRKTQAAELSRHGLNTVR